MEGGELITLGILWFVVFLFSTTVHEAAHALVAWRLGDPTAYHGGQVTLNPAPHVAREPIGTVVVPILSYVFTASGGSPWMMGWASAPYDPLWADRHPRRAAWMALAGPVSNLLLLVVSGLLIRGFVAAGHLRPPDTLELTRVAAAVEPGPWVAVAALLSVLFVLNLLLFVFNLLPLPPLDGAAVLPLVIGEDLAGRYRDFMSQPGFGLLGLLLAWRLLGFVFDPAFDLALALLYPDVAYVRF